MTPPVNVAEVLFRQAPLRGNPLFVDRTVTPPVHRSAFRPSRVDHDGLSLIRSSYRSLEWSGCRPEKEGEELYVIELPVKQLSDIGQISGFPAIEFRCSPDALDDVHGEPFAHCTVLQINRTDYDKDRDSKNRILKWTEKLSESISLAQVHGPLMKPTADVPYRPNAPAS